MLCLFKIFIFMLIILSFSNIKKIVRSLLEQSSVNSKVLWLFYICNYVNI